MNHCSLLMIIYKLSFVFISSVLTEVLLSWLCFSSALLRLLKSCLETPQTCLSSLQLLRIPSPSTIHSISVQGIFLRCYFNGPPPSLLIPPPIRSNQEPFFGLINILEAWPNKPRSHHLPYRHSWWTQECLQTTLSTESTRNVAIYQDIQRPTRLESFVITPKAVRK